MNRTNKSRSANSSGSESNARGSGEKPGDSRITFMVVVLILLIGVGTGIVYFMTHNGTQTISTPDITANGASSDLNSNTIYNGVYVDDIPLGGLTRNEAKDQIVAKQKTYANADGVTITYNAQSWLFKISDTSYSFDTDAILALAWNQGRVGTTAERQAFIKQLPANPIKLKTTVTADPSALEQKVRNLAAPYTVAPVNAAYAGYDAAKPDGQRLSFTPDTPGQQVDADALWAAVKKDFAERTFGTVPMQVVPVDAQIKLADLQTNMQLISSFNTQIKNHSKERLTNIGLASAAISGKLVLPGETFSMNDATRERTAAKGYQKAPIDANGINDVGLGGGVCQVSGTLYNAAIAAGPNRIQIVERNHHSIPSLYMKMGTDATVDYGHYDLKFKNISDKPILLIEFYAKDAKGIYREYAEFYGSPDPEGASYSLLGMIVETIPADITSPTRFVPNSAVAPGTTKSFPAHVGYKVNVYLVKIAKDGTKTQTYLYQDYYPKSQNIVAFYKSDPMPTCTPTPSPTPDTTLTPATTAPTPEPATPAPTPTPAPTSGSD